MKLRKYINGICACATVAMLTAFVPFTVDAAPQDYELKAMTEFKTGEKAAEPETKEVEATVQEMSFEEALQAYAASGYKYTSERYGYSIICPYKPAGVIPLSSLYENERGDVLIFENEGYDIKQAWIVMVNAYNDNDLPDLSKMDEKQQQALIDKLMNGSGYEFVRIADINGRKGIYCVTAKIIDVDTNGDGKPDETLESDTQMIKTYFQGQFGGHYSIQLIDNPDLTRAGVQAYQMGICTFQEWPTKRQEGKNVSKEKEHNKKSDKKVKDKKVKK